MVGSPGLRVCVDNEVATVVLSCVYGWMPCLRWWRTGSSPLESPSPASSIEQEGWCRLAHHIQSGCVSLLTGPGCVPYDTLLEVWWLCVCSQACLPPSLWLLRLTDCACLMRQWSFCLFDSAVGARHWWTAPVGCFKCWSTCVACVALTFACATMELTRLQVAVCG